VVLSRSATGKTGERLASQYLKTNGYTIVDLNFKVAIGEIDIIAKKKGMLHFFEVKTRRGIKFGSPFEAITPIKKERIRRVAEWFLMKHRQTKMPCLFGVIGIDLSKEPPDISCLVDAF